MVRDDEIQRLVSYAKGLGLRVKFTSAKTGDDALWTIDNTEIEIRKNEKEPKINTVLSLIHELGHALHNIHEKNREVDPKLDNALDEISIAEELELDAPKKERRVLLEHERAGTTYWHSVYKEANIQFPIWKLERQIEYDVFQYEYFYEHGKYPIKKIRKEKFKELTRKYRV